MLHGTKLSKIMDQNNVRRGFYRLDYMVIKGKNAFIPPSKPDVHVTWEEDIILQGRVAEPEPAGLLLKVEPSFCHGSGSGLRSSTELQ